MDTRRRYRAPAAEPFASLMQERSLAGFIIEPMPPMEVRDRYLDTEEGALLAQNLMFRVREHGGVATATLRSVEGEDEVAHVRFKSRPFADTVQLPEGELREVVEAHTGGRPLGILLHLRQYRTARALYDGDRLVAVLSLDVIADLSESGDVAESDDDAITNEIEVELVHGGGRADLLRLDRELQERGFSLDPFSKYERGLIRRSRVDDAPIYLLPRERAVLEQLRGSDSAVERRRAEVVLLAADRLGTREISRAVSLSPSRVRHWRHAFRQQRLRVFDDQAPDVARVEAPEPLRAFQVKEVLSYVPPDLPPSDVEKEGRQNGKEAAGNGSVPEGILAEMLKLVAEPPGPEQGDGGGRDSSKPGGDESTGERSDESDAETLLKRVTPARGDGKRTSIDWPIIKAAVRELEGVAEALAEANTALIEDDSAGAIQEAQQALERLRLTLDFFTSTLPEGEASPILHTGMRAAATLTEAAGLQRAQEALETAPDSEAARLTWALARTVWGGERRRHLIELAGTEVLLELSEQVSTLVLKLRQEQENGPAQLGHVLASSLWRRYETLRVHEESFSRGETSATVLHALLADLAYLLGFVGSDAGDDVALAVTQACAVLEERIAADDLADRLQNVMEEWIRPGGAVDPEPLGRLLADARAASETASERFKPLWEVVLGVRFRQTLGRISASI